MGAKTLSRMRAQRDLGVLMSDTASFSDHIHAQVNKANKMQSFICRSICGSKTLLPTLRSLYVALVCPRLRYASEIQSPNPVTMIKRIEGVQRRATRLMLPDFSYNQRLKRLNLLPLVQHREVKDLTTFYKLKCGHFNFSFDSYFQFCSDERLRSYSSNKLKINRIGTELFKGTFFNRITYLWNNLPDELRTANFSVSSYKRLCTTFYKDKAFDPEHPYTTWAKISSQ